MKKIYVDKGQYALVDDEDFGRLSGYDWHLGKGYAKTLAVINRRRSVFGMHRIILGDPQGVEIDHINRNPLDNRKSNLRFCIRLENAKNRKKNCNNSSGFKGVTWRKGREKWRAGIRVDGRRIELGLFDDLIEAAKVYDSAAKFYHGTFAALNFTSEA